jgi:hypothetical protein
MNGELWADSQSLNVASGALLYWGLQYRGTAMEKNSQKNKLNTNEQPLLLEKNNLKIRSNRKQITPGAEEGYCYGWKCC